MPRVFQNKNVRAQWSLDNAKLAIAAVRAGTSLKKASKDYAIPRTTLRRKLKLEMSGYEIKKVLGGPSVLSHDQELQLVKVILDYEARLFGLTVSDIRRLVYQFCTRNKIKHPFNNIKQLAGEDWASAFLKRHPTLSVRKPESVSIFRAAGFNKEKVNRFYDALESVLIKDNVQIIPPSNIFNVDESGFTVCHKPHKIVCRKGKKSVGSLTSAERGKTITAVCCVNACGTFIPPMLIFPRARFKPELIDKAPPGSIGGASKTGWINEELFSVWFDHFLHCVQAKSRPDPVLLILDGHSSHTKNLNVILKAKDNNCIILSLPSHCTHRLQPLDISFFKSLNSFYDIEIQTWLRSHPGRVVTEFHISELFSAAYGKAASIKNGCSGFEKAGIYPFRRDIFTDDDFLSAQMTDKFHLHPVINTASGVMTEPATTTTKLCESASPIASNLDRVDLSQIDILDLHSVSPCLPRSLPLDAQPISLKPSATCVPLIMDLQKESACMSYMSVSVHLQEEPLDPSSVPLNEQEESSNLSAVCEQLEAPAKEPMPVLLSEPEEFPGPASMSVSLELDTSIADTSHLSFDDILNDKIVVKPLVDRKRKRPVLHSTVLTSSPYKSKLSQEKGVVKSFHVGKGKGKVSKYNSMSQSAAKDPVSSIKKKNVPKCKAGGGKGKKHAGPKKVDAKCDANCLYCNERWSDSVDPFIKCQGCSLWAHTECAGVSPRCNRFVCEHCKD